MWGGFALGLLLVGLRPAFGLIDDYNPIFLLGGIAIGFAAVGAAFLHRRRALAGLLPRCASCDAPLVARGKWKDVAPWAELVVATGMCPTCRNHFIGMEATSQDADK